MRDAAYILHFSFNYYNAYVSTLLFKEDLWIDRHEQLKNSRGHAQHKIVGTLIPRVHRDFAKIGILAILSRGLSLSFYHIIKGTSRP